ncbi:MAG: hypothetical protein A4E28_00277 [Methanocella sp. PtaU1.Bin125]|nr:MAG: hypothetical protein A4E28_00277 [Methanocella sp. PtaU1.Bin125]
MMKNGQGYRGMFSQSIRMRARAAAVIAEMADFFIRR